MEKENKISKGIVIGCFVIVLALTVWVININDTYSTSSTTAPECEPGYTYITIPAPLGNDGACCPSGGTGYDSVRKKCTATLSKDGTCPSGYNKYGDVHMGYSCSADSSNPIEYSCYSCTGVPNYVWDYKTPSSGCSGGNWQVVSKSQSECVTPTFSCYFCTGEPDYTWSAGTPSKSCNGGSWQRVSKSYTECKLPASTTKSCYFCTGEPDYVWSAGTPSKSCNGGSWQVISRTESNCVAPTSSCYFCTGEPDYVWGTGTPSKSCNGGSWQVVSDSNCKSSGTTPTTGGTTPTKGGTTPTKGGTKPSKGGTTPTKGGTKPSKGGGSIPIIPSSIISPRVYKATFYPNGGTWADGTTGAKTIQYTGEMYFSESELKVIKNGYTLKGWQSSDGSIFTVRIDGSNNNDTLTAIWVSSSSSGGGSTTNPGIGDDETCDFISKDSCEIAYSEFNCVKDKNNCYVKGSKKTVLSDDPISNPNTGNSLLYLSIIIGVITFGYTVYYTSKIRKKEDNHN